MCATPPTAATPHPRSKPHEGHQGVHDDLVRRGEFPVPVIRLGRTVRVPRAALNNLLGVS